jgi:hypothetical protein
MPDENEIAARILWAATHPKPSTPMSPQERLKRAGQALGTTKRMNRLSAEELTAQAKKAAATRWRG